MRSPTRNRLFVDVTTVYLQGGRSGIPRVVRKYVEHLDLCDDYQLVCFVHVRNSFYAVPSESISGPRRLARLAKWLRASLRIHNYRWLPLYTIGLAFWDAIAEMQMHVLALKSVVAKIDRFDKGDIIFMPYVPRGASYAPCMARCDRGAFTIAMVHDLFPLQYPGHYFPELRSIFERGLAVQTDLADLVVCVSGTTAEHVTRYLTNKGSRKPVSVVYLGSDFDDALTESRDNGPECRRDPAIPTLLSVGGLEPRKNYTYALMLCDLLWKSGMDFRYVIAGRMDSYWPQIARAIRRHPEFGRRLLHYESTDDAGLLDLYRTSSCLLAMSIDEGFGLPGMEARRVGLPLVCSDIPIFHELHPAADFIPLEDAAAAAAAIARVLRRPRPWNGPARNDRNAGALITWQDSAAQFLETITSSRAECLAVRTQATG